MNESEMNAGVWLAYARDDLANAKILHGNGGTVASVCFHAQQAAEKALKGVLVRQGMDVPRIHNLNSLATTVGSDRLGDLGEAMASLNRWMTISRYPDEATEQLPGGDEATLALAWASDIVAIAGALIEA